MIQLPLINLYPIQTRKPTKQEIALHVDAINKGFPSVLPVQQVAATPLDFACEMAEQHGAAGLSNALEDNMRQSDELNNALNVLPSINELPEIFRYKYEYKESNIEATAKEVQRLGYLLSKGQTLFHGGNWINSDLSIGEMLEFDSVLSCTFDAQVAGVHANYHRNEMPCIWLITIVNNHGLPCYIFDLDDHVLGQEKEVLLAGISHLVCRKVHHCNNFPVIEVDAY